MKFFTVISLMLLLAFSSCKKNNSSDSGENNDPPVPTSNCRLTSETRIFQGDSTFILYEYSPEGKLIRAIATGGFYGTYHDTVKYVYNGNLCWYHCNGEDTTFHTYNGGGKLISYLYKYRISYNEFFEEKHEYTYDSEDRVILEQKFMKEYDPDFEKTDSTIYQYSGGNVTNLTRYHKTTEGWINKIYTILYDSHPNYRKTHGHGTNDYQNWSKNNVLSVFESGLPLTEFTYTEFNESGYPLRMEFWYPPYEDSRSIWLLTYECW